MAKYTKKSPKKEEKEKNKSIAARTKQLSVVPTRYIDFLFVFLGFFLFLQFSFFDTTTDLGSLKKTQTPP